MRHYPTETLNNLSIEIGKTNEDWDVLYWLWFKLIPYYFNFFMFNPDVLAWDNASKELYLVFMKSILLQIGKQAIFSQNIWNLLHGFYVFLAWIFGVDEDVIQIYNYKDIKVFGQDPIDISLETCWGIG